MKNGSKFVALIAAGLLSVAAFAIENAVHVSASGPAKSAPGKDVTILVKFNVKSGYHIYGPGKIETGIPTEVAVQAPKGFKVKKTTYPATTMFKALGETVPVFEHQGVIKVTLSSPASAHGKQNFVVKVKSQACNDRTCLMPTTDEAKVSINFQK